MPEYDSNHYDPPAPVASVTLRNSETKTALANVLMLIDTGADVTLIPKTAAEQLGIAIPDVQYELMSFDGELSRASMVRAEIVFLRRTFRGQFLLTDQPSGILGRNILNVM